MKSFKDLREKTLTPAEKKKREEIAKAKANKKPEKFVKPHPEVIKAYKKKLAADDKAADWNYGGSKARLTRATNHLTKKIDQHHPGLDTQGRIDLYTTLQNMKEAVEEKTLTSAEKKKREEIAKAMERENPGMDMGKKMAIATATAKRVAEAYEPKKSHFVYQRGVVKSKQVVHRGTEQSSKDWITKNAKHFEHKGRDFDIYKGKYPNVKPSDRVDFRHVAEETQPDQIELDEKVYASDYNVGHEKSQFGGYRPHVTHKKTGKTMYLGSTSYKTPKHAKGHAAAYLNGYEKINDKHADRKGREYAQQNKQHQYVKESLDEGIGNNMRLISKIKKSGVVKSGSMSKDGSKPEPKKEELDITEISLDMLTKKISNSGMATTKKANKMDKTKNDLAAMRARLAGKPALAKEAVQSADKKPEKFIKPDGTVGIRMVRTDKKVVDKDA